MEEKIIIKSKLKEPITLCAALASLGLLIYLIDAWWVANCTYDQVVSYVMVPRGYSYEVAFQNALGFSNENNFILIPLVFLFPLAAYVIYRTWSKSTITLTDKRVYGINAMGNRVDLPVDTITAVGTGIFSSLKISTASTAIFFVMLANRDELQRALSKLLVERQSKPTYLHNGYK